MFLGEDFDMAIDKQTVKYVAHLARIQLNNTEIELLSRQLEDIVSFIDKLKQVDISGVKPTSHVLPINSVFREDKASEPLSSKEALNNAPKQKENFFLVPKVIE